MEVHNREHAFLHPDAAEFLLNMFTEAAGAAGQELLEKGLALGMGGIGGSIGDPLPYETEK